MSGDSVWGKACRRLWHAGIYAHYTCDSLSRFSRMCSAEQTSVLPALRWQTSCVSPTRREASSLTESDLCRRWWASIWRRPPPRSPPWRWSHTSPRCCPPSRPQLVVLTIVCVCVCFWHWSVCIFAERNWDLEETALFCTLTPADGSVSDPPAASQAGADGHYDGRLHLSGGFIPQQQLPHAWWTSTSQHGESLPKMYMYFVQFLSYNCKQHSVKMHITCQRSQLE